MKAWTKAPLLWMAQKLVLQLVFMHLLGVLITTSMHGISFYASSVSIEICHIYFSYEEKNTPNKRNLCGISVSNTFMCEEEESIFY